MEIVKLHLDPQFLDDKKTAVLYQQIQTLLKLIEQKQIPVKTVEIINRKIMDINFMSFQHANVYKPLKQMQTDMIKLLEKDHKLVPRNYYRNIWLAAGMGAFGLPIGAAFGLLIGNIALLSIGLPIGMAIGVGLGTSLDKKAAAEGRQLDIEIRH
ncbi:hypothetical protein MKJ01_11375 [Chryseobacterium sp. SSA4.19]|uniref:hypothetical protein n=1 Tax=Chryseobacterium sp. SSA4.19 TaxID=2919915 RepID=UPI001F4ED006|nr:hypothetical protein [Chryseobacterium sp. SSA4.19]MCJ8154361.1 hypothetical protein [Chryseobacterium sp. SSA4.19]